MEEGFLDSVEGRGQLGFGLEGEGGAKDALGNMAIF